MHTPRWLVVPLLVVLPWTATTPADAADPSPTVILDSTSGKQAPGLALGGNGDAVAVWAEGSALKASVRPAGGSWSAPEPVSTADHGTPYAQVVVDATGFTTVVWTQWNSGGHYSHYVTRPAGGAWSAVKDLEPGSYGEAVVLDLAADGTVTAAWQSPSGSVRVSRHPVGSSTWTTPVTAGSGFSPVLATGPGGHQALAWTDSVSGRVKARVIASGGDWAAASTEDVSPAGAPAYDPRIAFGPGDVLEAAWSQLVTSTPNTEEVHGASRSASGTWTNYGTALSGVDVTTRPSGIAVDSSGDVTVVWTALHANFSNHLRSRTRHNGVWEAQSQTISETAVAGAGRLVVDADDTFTVVYAGDPAATTSRTATTTWATPTPLASTGSVSEVAAQLDGDGRALVVWLRDYYNGTFHSVVEALLFTPASPSDTAPPSTTLGVLPTWTTNGHAALAWTATDAQSLVNGTDVRSRSAAWNGTFDSDAMVLAGTSARSASIPVAPGRTACFAARATDTAGNVGDWSAEQCIATPADDRVARKSKGWTRKSGAGFYGGSSLLSRHRGATLTLPAVHARRLALLVSTGRGQGRVAVFWRGTRLGTWSLASSARGHQRLIPVAGWSEVRAGKLVVKVVSSGKPVRIDGFGISQG